MRQQENHRRKITITFERALEKARGYYRDIDNCAEYTDAFVFTNEDARVSIGGPGPVVILKDTGKAVNMTYYVDASKGKYIRDIPCK